ncbi:major facilitator superfamily domain-containing protein [Lasiosphaeris hirsuta]|uniref:Major facilitator superfamily domain-containing protein n=1 Tax=Lasiosphaeris hirsuta TaxID=260670 RepID=A0AA39ZRD6_9PEZI|nr:major facilitator superfamily domain-containing protein [Lasiosphaeris hirsuta]
MSSWTNRLAKESSFSAIARSSRDTKLLCLQRFISLFGYGIVSHPRSVSFWPGLHRRAHRGYLTAITDKIGRRRVLAAGAASLTASGLIFSLSSNYWYLLFASVFGVISPSGNEIGPFRAVEESILAHLTNKDERSDIFAWYTLFGTAGAALGTLTCGWIVQSVSASKSWTLSGAHSLVFVLYAALGIANLVLVYCQTLQQLNIVRLQRSWTIRDRSTIHSLEPSALGMLFLVANLLVTFSNLAALPLARHLGPLKTMHSSSLGYLPSLDTYPPATNSGMWLAMAFLALRACTQSIDQAPRQAFLAAAVLSAERTAVLGVVNVIKTLA